MLASSAKQYSGCLFRVGIEVGEWGKIYGGIQPTPYTLHPGDFFSSYCGMGLWGVGFVD